MEDYKPHIGKNVIETLTLGMYENAHFIYREYVQNAADQIDVAVEEGMLDKKSDGRIDISIDKENKSISIEDNATGIKSSEVLQFLGDVANSQKDRTKRKGFRGIGRLGGLGYCDTLIFETSFKGESTKSIIILDAKQLKEIISDRSVTMDAATVISVITTLDKENEIVDEHYFKVRLINVTNDELLDEISVKNYLSMVAPVPFNKDFTFAKDIHKYFNKNNVKIEEYDVHLSLNNEKLFKAYKMNMHSKFGFKPVKIINIEFMKFFDNENVLIALSWYGVTNLLNMIIHQDDIERGFRIRKDNIQIGSEDTLNGFFKEDRFNHHFIGEIYVIGDAFIPNARRDYFNDDINENKTIKIFNAKLKKELNNLYDLSHRSSEINSGIDIIKKYKEEEEIYENKTFKTEYEERQEIIKLEKLKKDAKKGQLKIKKALEKSLSNNSIINAAITIYKHKVGDIDLSIDHNVVFDTQEYEQPILSKLDVSAKEIVFEIFEIIEEIVFDSKIVVELKKKIAERYN